MHDEQFKHLSQRLDETIYLLRLLLKVEVTEMSILDDLQADVTENATVVDSAVALLGNLSAQLAAAGTDPVKLADIKNTLDASKQRLAESIAANTPAAPPAP